MILEISWCPGSGQQEPTALLVPWVVGIRHPDGWKIWGFQLETFKKSISRLQSGEQHPEIPARTGRGPVTIVQTLLETN